MKSLLLICFLCLSTSLPALATNAVTSHDGRPHNRAYDLPDHDPIGQPGTAASVARTIEVKINETENGYMLFEPDAIHIEHGSNVRFIIDNPGSLDHEFFLGSFEEIEKHKNWMRTHPDMKHDDANSITVRSGEVGELVWHFSSKVNLAYVCLLPGHHEAGMWGVIMVHDHLAP